MPIKQIVVPVYLEQMATEPHWKNIIEQQSSDLIEWEKKREDRLSEMDDAISSGYKIISDHELVVYSETYRVYLLHKTSDRKIDQALTGQPIEW